MIEIFFTNATLEDGALATERFDAAAKLLCGGVRVRERQYRKRLKTGRIGSHGLGQGIINVACQIHAVMPQVVQARRRQRVHLHIDAGFVHQR